MSQEEYQEKQLADGTVRRRVRREAGIQKTKPHTLHLPAPISRILQESGLLDLLAGVDVSCRTVLFHCPATYRLAGLPAGYFFKGGAAREQLRLLLAGDTQSKVQVRDFDLFRYMDSPDMHDHELALRYMPDDYEYGRGVEVVENKKTYFSTRDLTVNEVLAWNDHVEASFGAITDMANSILRPTPFVQNKAGEVLSVTVAKAYRFAAEAQLAGRPCSLVFLPEDAFVSDFAAALNLERSFMTNEAVATEYLQLLWERTRVFKEWQVPPPAVDAVRELSTRIPNGLRLFKSLPASLLKELIRNS